MDSTTENDYFELEPFDQYKPAEAKFQASLKWLFTKAYSTQLPTHLNEPFFEENELGKSLRHDILIELINAKVYCKACKNIFASNGFINSKTFSDVSDVIEQLAKTSIQVTDENDDPVTAQIITQDEPFYVSAHLALIDSLMIAYSMKAMRLDNVINSVKKYTKFNPSNELPNSLESTCVLWLNKIMKTILNCVDYECELYIKQSGLVGCQSHLFLPEIGTDISLTLSSGTLLAALIVFYTCNVDIDLSDIAIHENVGFEESVENLNLVKEFCDKYISSKPFCFNFEDFLYSPYSMKINKIAFISELFYWFEVQPLTSLIRPNHFDLFKAYIKEYTKKHFHATTSFISSRIGDVTRNSFIKGSYTPIKTTQTNDDKLSNNPDNNTNTNSSTTTITPPVNGSLISNNQFIKNDKKRLLELKNTTITTTNNNHNNPNRPLIDNFKINNLSLSNYSKSNKKKLINGSHNSFNSLLDNVALDASQIYDESTTTITNKNNQDEDEYNSNETQVHPMFTSRTYIKSSSNTRLNQSNEIKSSESNNSPRLSNQTNNNNNNSINLNQQLQQQQQEQQTMNTTASLNNQIRDDLHKNADLILNGSNMGLAQQQQQQQQNPQTTSSSNGVVRRLSVTARPGDIFYKVKDVTETSTTDTLTYETNINNNIITNIENDYAEIDNLIDDEEKEIIIKPIKNETKQQEAINTPNSTTTKNVDSHYLNETKSNSNDTTVSNQPNGSLNRKTTTWNVKRHQTTSLGINQPSEPVKAIVPKDDTAITKQTSLTQIEPGSPLFTKELLSIKMQLKEKKNTMERDKRKLESELEKQRQQIGKQVFLQVVQKKPQQQTNESIEKQHQQLQNSSQPALTVMTANTLSQSPQTVMEQQLLADRSQLFNSSSPKLNSNSNLLKETPRRQWDKTQKGFIDLENASPTNNTSNTTRKSLIINNNNNNTNNNVNGNHANGASASSTSSMSTPSSSASQSPPLSNGRLNYNSNQNNDNDLSSSSSSSSSKLAADQKALDLSKAYYTREELIKTIEVLSSTTVNNKSALQSQDIDTELQRANIKLAELQTEITRLHLLQQQKVQKVHSTNIKQLVNDTNDDHKHIEHISLNENKQDTINNDGKPSNNHNNNTEDDSENHSDGAFFISFGNGTAKREKPPALTPKKNLIFVKTNDDNVENGNKTKQKPMNNNLLMTATNNTTITANPAKISNRNIDKCDDCSSSSSDSDSAELKQRKREQILAKQIERRQQQELIRQKRDEERARKAEEIRLKEEEAANKKLLEKARKETIFQAYIEKKKQLENESLSFGAPPSSLLNAKKFHSTYRLRPSNSTNNFPNQQQKQQFDQFDQASVISDRSSNLQYTALNGTPPQPMIKTYSTNNLYQGSNNNNSNNNNNNNSNKRQSRVLRPPSCARPTISSLRKMNRTFSLNNVADIGSNTNTAINNNNTTNNNNLNGGVMTSESNKNVVVPLTQATINAFNTNSARFNYNNNSRNLINDNNTEESMSQLNYSCKLQSKYASSNYLNDYNQQQQQKIQPQQQAKQSQQQYPQRTRTTPRRRTPRNAEEFLIAAGVVDTESFLNRGYYVGSMLNLNEFTNNSSTITSSRSIQHQATQQSNHDNLNGVANAASSSSSSSASGFNNNSSATTNNKQINNVFKEQDLQMKRRNSIHDTTSISMANLNFLNNNFSPPNNTNSLNNNNNTNTVSKTPTQSYFRTNGYPKARSNTTAIIGLNDNTNDENYSNHHNNTNSNGSSALGSDSSSSPTPNGGQLKQQTNKLTLGPLMSAVSKLENVSLNSPKTDQRFNYSNQNNDNLLTFQTNVNEDDYDDYEYLERNLGAEPTNNTLINKNVNNTTNTTTTTNTNVTDYYTDESNSCNNEDFNQFNTCKLNKNDNLVYINEQSPLSINNNSSNNSCTTVASPYHQVSTNMIAPNNNYYYSNGNNNTNNNGHVMQHHHHHHLHHPVNTNPVNNAWDQASVISNNNAFSEIKGDDLIDVTTQPYDDLIKSANLLLNSRKNHRNSACILANQTTNTGGKFTSQQHLNEEMCKLLMQLNNNNTDIDSTTSTSYNKIMNTSYVISASHTPTSMSFVSQISPNNQLLFTNTESHSKLGNFSDLNDLPMSSALSFLSSTLYSSSKAFNDEVKKQPQPDSHTTSNFTDTMFKLKEVDNSNNTTFIGEPIVSPRSHNTSNIKNTNCNTYRPSRPNQLPSSTSLYSFKQSPSSTTSIKQKKTVNSKLQSQLMSPTDNQSKTSLNSLHTNDADYSGPKLFKRLTGKSNKLTIINSLNQRVLAGTVNAAVRKQVIEEIEQSDARHFIILFRDYHLQYRGVYSYTTETDYIEKVVGQGPQKISEDMVETYFKYNSGARQFSSVPTKHFSVQCDGVTIHSVFWATRKQSTPQTNVAQLGNGQSQANYGTLRR